MILSISGLHANIADKEILKGLDLMLATGETHAIMGPNGSGKSTLSNVIMGNPMYEVTAGDIVFESESLRDMEADERARKGIFMAFQYPREIPGVTFAEFLRASYISVQKARNENFQEPSIFDFKKLLRDKMKLLKMKSDFLDRYVNQGFSGGEKKKAEMLQLLLLEPKLAILDETDSGLDVDALRLVGEAVSVIRQTQPEVTLLVITHYQRILEHISPDFVHVMVDGRIVQSGDKNFAKELETSGYEHLAPEISQGLKML